MKFIIFISFFWFIGQSLLAQETIKMVRVKGQPIIVGELNGKKAYFLVDTGSDITLLNAKDANRYKFKYGRSVIKGHKLSGFGSQHTGDILVAYNVDLYLGTRKMEVGCRVFDLTNIVDSTLR